MKILHEHFFLIVILTLNWLFVPSPAWAGTIIIDLGGKPITIPVDDKRINAIQQITDAANLKRPNLSDGTRPEDLTREQYMADRNMSTINSYVFQVRQREAAEYCKAMADNPILEQEVRDLVGGKSPCI